MYMKCYIGKGIRDGLVVVEVLESLRSRALARKPCKGDQNTAGGERSAAPTSSLLSLLSLFSLLSL